METLQGVENFKAPPERVFAEITDMGALSKHVPNVETSEVVNSRTLKCVVRPGFSFVRGKLRLTIELAESTPCEHALLRISAAGVGMGIDVDSQIEIAPGEKPGSSRLSWRTRVLKRNGLLSLVSPALIQGAAEQTIREGWASLRSQVEVRNAT